MDGLRPQRIKATKSKKIKPLITPEAKSFREETSKLTNWTQHRRITEYLEQDPEENPKMRAYLCHYCKTIYLNNKPLLCACKSNAFFKEYTTTKTEIEKLRQKGATIIDHTPPLLSGKRPGM